MSGNDGRGDKRELDASLDSDSTSVFSDPSPVASINNCKLPGHGLCLSPPMSPVHNGAETGVETTRKISRRPRSYSCGQAFPMQKSMNRQSRSRRCFSYPISEHLRPKSAPNTSTQTRRHSASLEQANIPSSTNRVPIKSRLTPASVSSSIGSSSFVSRHQRSSSVCEPSYMRVRPDCAHTQCRRSSSLKILTNGLVMAFEEVSQEASPNEVVVGVGRVVKLDKAELVCECNLLGSDSEYKRHIVVGGI